MRRQNSHRLIAGGALSLVIGYWLFADTVTHYYAIETDELRLSYWGGVNDDRMWREVVAALAAREPEVQVRVEWLPLTGYMPKIEQQLMAGDAPDVMMFQDEPFPRYASDHFLSVDEFASGDPVLQRRLDDCWPSAIQSFTCDGRLRGVPIHGGNVLIYCNLEAFDRASRHHGRAIQPPDRHWSLEEFVATAKDLTIDADGDGRVDQFGFLQPGWVYFMPFVWSHGARFCDESRRRWTFTGEEAVAALEFYADLRHRWGVTPSPDAYAGQNSDTAFLSGRVAMCVNGPWFEPFLCETRLRDRYRVVDIPSGPGGSATRATWDALCIHAKASPRRSSRAWRFVRFAVSREAQLIFAKYRRAVPVRRSCADAYVAYGGGPGSAADRFAEEMAAARTQPITRAWIPMSRALGQHFISVLLDGHAHRSGRQAVAAMARDPLILESFAVDLAP